MPAGIGRVDAVWFVYQKVKPFQAVGCTRTDPFRPTFESLCVEGVSFVAAKSDQTCGAVTHMCSASRLPAVSLITMPMPSEANC